MMDRDRALELALDWFRHQTHRAGPVIPQIEPFAAEADSWLVTLQSSELDSTVVVLVNASGVTPYQAAPLPPDDV